MNKPNVSRKGKRYVCVNCFGCNGRGLLGTQKPAPARSLTRRRASKTKTTYGYRPIGVASDYHQAASLRNSALGSRSRLPGHPFKCQCSPPRSSCGEQTRNIKLPATASTIFPSNFKPCSTNPCVFPSHRYNPNAGPARSHA